MLKYEFYVTSGIQQTSTEHPLYVKILCLTPMRVIKRGYATISSQRDLPSKSKDTQIENNNTGQTCVEETIY